jgi:hypothetical protein
VRKSEVPVGTLAAGTFTDNAGDTGAAKFVAAATSRNTWTIRPNDTPTATPRRSTPPRLGQLRDNTCMGLESQTVFLGANPTLSFSSRYDMEQGWDGGYVDVSTEAGGFTNWTKLTTVNYPGVMTGPQGDPACGDSRLRRRSTGLHGDLAERLPDVQWIAVRLRQPAGPHPLPVQLGPSTNQTGWFVDNISVSDAKVPGALPRRGLGQGLGSPAARRQGSGHFGESDLPGSRLGRHRLQRLSRNGRYLVQPCRRSVQRHHVGAEHAGPR